jgi:hypothetical protein
MQAILRQGGFADDREPPPTTSSLTFSLDPRIQDEQFAFGAFVKAQKGSR